MKKYVNGECIELTESEIAEMEEVRLQYEAAERHRPLTIGEVAEMLIRQQINTLVVDDQTALRMIAFYPEWESDKDYAAGDKLVSGGKLYKVLQAHTSQSTWATWPSKTASITRRATCCTGARAIPATRCITRWRSWSGFMWRWSRHDLF